MASHQRVMDIQITQIAQQVSILFRPQGQLLGQPETNPRGHMDTISAISEELVESPVMVIQEAVSVPISTRTEEKENLASLGSNEKITSSPSIHTYKPPIPYP